MIRYFIATILLGAAMPDRRIAETHLLPQAGRLIRADAFAAELAIQKAADGERVVANHFGIHAEARAASEQTVVGVALEQLWGEGGGLAVGRGRDEEAEDGFDIPIVMRDA